MDIADIFDNVSTLSQKSKASSEKMDCHATLAKTVEKNARKDEKNENYKNNGEQKMDKLKTEETDMKQYKVVDASRPVFYQMRNVGDIIELPEDVGNGWVEVGLIAPLISETEDVFDKIISKSVNIDEAISKLETTIASLESDLEKAQTAKKPKAEITKIEKAIAKARAELLLLSEDDEEVEDAKSDSN